MEKGHNVSDYNKNPIGEDPLGTRLPSGICGLIITSDWFKRTLDRLSCG